MAVSTHARHFLGGVMGSLATEPGLDLFFEASAKCLAIPTTA